MLDRLLIALVNGPSLNCRPHASRQRVDLTQFAKLGGIAPESALCTLLGNKSEVALPARVPLPRRRAKSGWKFGGAPEPELTPEESEAERKWLEQEALLRKLRTIAEDARTYEQDTGVQVLNIGFPLLALPPGKLAGATRRILAPLALIPVSLTVKSGPTPTVHLACTGDGVDRVSPNVGLLAWLEQQTGVRAEDLFADEGGTDPWREIGELVRHVAKVLELNAPPAFAPDVKLPAGDGGFTLQAAPRAEDDAEPQIIRCGVLGLFPAANQGLLRDMQALAAGTEAISGPLASFIRLGAGLEQSAERKSRETPPQRQRQFADERLITLADPCQARAVRLAREANVLVIHGPPGTGKSQTIANIIGDYLARGLRVLMVCDKRTALDVVANRLEHHGLGQLCALIHDPQRDQRVLYKAIREQLESLPEAKSNSHVERQLERIDGELQRLHSELSDQWSALMAKDPVRGYSFHDLMGRWLSTAIDEDVQFDPAPLEKMDLATLEEQTQTLREILRRGQAVGYPDNPWVGSAGVTLAELLGRPMDEWRAKLGAAIEAARGADATADPAIPPFDPKLDLDQQAQVRTELGGRLSRLIEQAPPERLAHWSRQMGDALKRARQRLADVKGHFEQMKASPLDAELLASVRSDLPRLAAIAQQLLALDSYIQIAGGWTHIFHFRQKSRASEVLARYGLMLSLPNAQRLRTFLQGLRARLLVQEALLSLTGTSPIADLMDDVAIESSYTGHAAPIEFLCWLLEQTALGDVRARALAAASGPQTAGELLKGLARSPARATALRQAEDAAKSTGLFSATWLAERSAAGRAGTLLAEQLGRQEEKLDTLEGVLRINKALGEIASGLQEPLKQLLSQDVDDESGLKIIRKGVLAAEITRLLKTTPHLQAIDAQRVQSSFDRYRELEGQKRELVQRAVQQRWLMLQQERLLASTGSRLNSLGADLRRRLTLRGERAMRLRQVVTVGREIEGGDPLFDLRPVWMTSPETAAQLFPRKPLFDVLIFDEASQCRLEEALPVLTRSGRVVIAGDQQQLPPTRFFESAVAASEDDQVESEQDLFEAQQSEIEDLLAASLNVEVQECYLDVHYRSRNADLIQFSNEHFYNSRLQAIPAHPCNRMRQAPITLYAVNGVYEKRCNPAEADQVCRIVAELLRRSEPPSIGIACFNLQQRDLILDKLDEMADGDAEFAARLAEARQRRGNGSFEGLFVRNLENVQGDERDHIIISTTYGPDASGRFYRRFGPLGRQGGGRRLNVLVTRARREVHLVSSIPASEYRNLPPVPPGQTPTGAWLLFAYLAFAERLKRAYEQAPAEPAQAPVSTKAEVRVLPLKAPSLFSEALATQLAASHNIGSDVHWGNDGFSIDLALRHPRAVSDVTIGILCDGCRFEQAEDPVEWDMFRTGIHESQGWKLHRLWTPHFFRDPQGAIKRIADEMAEFVEREPG